MSPSHKLLYLLNTHPMLSRDELSILEQDRKLSPTGPCISRAKPECSPPMPIPHHLTYSLRGRAHPAGQGSVMLPPRVWQQRPDVTHVTDALTIHNQCTDALTIHNQLTAACTHPRHHTWTLSRTYTSKMESDFVFVTSNRWIVHVPTFLHV